MNERQRFDAAAIKMLRRVGGDALASKMAEMFAAGAPKKLEAARAALAALDAPGLAIAAHSLKSSAGQLGASRLQEICADLEARSPTEQTRDSITQSIDLAEGAVREAVAWLRTTIGAEPEGMTRVAVVEDNPDNMLLVRLILEDLYEVDGYTNGIEALDGMEACVPAITLLDISLPGMDGLEVLSRMKVSDRLRAVPVIALTAHAALSDRDRFISAGFDDYLTKPIVDEKLLLSAISRLVGSERGK